jgi:hypothetical protein
MLSSAGRFFFFFFLARDVVFAVRMGCWMLPLNACIHERVWSVRARRCFGCGEHMVLIYWLADLEDRCAVLSLVDITPIWSQQRQHLLCFENSSFLMRSVLQHLTIHFIKK